MVDTLRPLSELLSLKGRRALITGSAMGIGKAIAYRFAEAGASLELVDKEDLNVVKKELSKFNVEINIHKMDVSKKVEIDTLWEKLTGREPDILVNCVGIYPFKSFLEVDESFLNMQIKTNLYSAFWMCQHMIRKRLQRGGVIINIGTIEAILPFEKWLAHYAISKAGVCALTRALAKEYGEYGFRINAVLPGYTMTPGTARAAEQLQELGIDPTEHGKRYFSRLPLGRIGEPEEVANMVLVLASDLSSYVHGALIPVDGGFLST
ncbi:MAG: SDR family NAD(P)-dependent oxidoreductase [Candidatus Freyarchaeota archaeon]